MTCATTVWGIHPGRAWPGLGRPVPWRGQWLFLGTPSFHRWDASKTGAANRRLRMFVELDEATSGALFERHAIRGSRVDEGHTSPSGGQACEEFLGAGTFVEDADSVRRFAM